MDYLTIEDLQDYTGVYPEIIEPEEGQTEPIEDKITKTQKQFVAAAIEIVNNYLGYDPTVKFATNGVPQLIKLTALRIAALLQTEAGGDIGITSKSFGMEGSRSFLNYTNYDKYLLPASAYRDIR